MSSTQSEQNPPMDADDLIEEEEDNAKIFHYAYGKYGSKMLNYSPYEKMTEEEFRKIVDEMTK